MTDKTHTELIAEMICGGTQDRDRWALMSDEIVWLEQHGFIVTLLRVAGVFTYCRVEITPAGSVLYLMQQANPEV
ncbi:MAG: hypothetical protein DI640_13145 [Sphingomonas taxi]|uniref:Uncharacterized protein n=1 Tax=Sphingomonas taxi TaxID=1549858 RepID=A0A2W4YRF3_9SPHN|nr:MAG: hypothetical protein DI640_13145 [Sphingomonas taxi]